MESRTEDLLKKLSPNILIRIFDFHNLKDIVYLSMLSVFWNQYWNDPTQLLYYKKKQLIIQLLKEKIKMVEDGYNNRYDMTFAGRSVHACALLDDNASLSDVFTALIGYDDYSVKEYEKKTKMIDRLRQHYLNEKTNLNQALLHLTSTKNFSMLFDAIIISTTPLDDDIIEKLSIYKKNIYQELSFRLEKINTIDGKIDLIEKVLNPQSGLYQIYSYHCSSSGYYLVGHFQETNTILTLRSLQHELILANENIIRSEHHLEN